MRRAHLFLIFLALFGPSASAAPRSSPTLAPPLAPLGFLVGRWTTSDGKLAEAGAAADGRSAFTIGAGGGALLRRDHAVLRGPDGKRAGSMDQVMLIYPEDGKLRADYTDGTHVIHYQATDLQTGRAVTFASQAGPGLPSYRLTYALDADGLAVRFEAAPPGSAAFKPVAEGHMRRAAPGGRAKAGA